MQKVFYVYNTKTGTYDRMFPSKKQRIFAILKRCFIDLGFAAICFGTLYWLLGTPSEKQMRMENEQLLSQYKLIEQQMNDAMEVIEDIQQRDDNLYRVILQSEPIDQSVRETGFRYINRYRDMEQLPNADIIIETTQKLDILKHQVYLQSKSFDELLELCKENEERLACIPAIQPVSNKDLKYTASGYGLRIDPIYKTRKFHHGMDFSADKGAPIYATGNGTVVKAGWQSGYGLMVEIDHGFGYKTRYAHMNKISVKKGQKMKRGETIGEVGSTGKSTGPHLHYEVVVKGQKVNPINYYYLDLSDEEYDRMVQMAENHGKVYD